MSSASNACNGFRVWLLQATTTGQTNVRVRSVEFEHRKMALLLKWFEIFIVCGFHNLLSIHLHPSPSHAGAALSHCLCSSAAWNVADGVRIKTLKGRCAHPRCDCNATDSAPVYVFHYYCLPRAPPTSNGPRFEVSCARSDGGTVRSVLLLAHSQPSHRICQLCSFRIRVATVRRTGTNEACVCTAACVCVCLCASHGQRRTDECGERTLTQPPPPQSAIQFYTWYMRDLPFLLLFSREISF